MSKKKQKGATDDDSIIFLLQRQVDRQDEIIDLLHVLVDNTKKSEPPNIGPMIQTGDGSWQRKRQVDWETLRGRKLGAAEEVEDYHGIAPSGDSPYAPVVRLR